MKTPNRQKLIPDICGTTFNCMNRRHTVIVVEGRLKLLHHKLEEYEAAKAMQAFGGELPKCFKLFEAWKMQRGKFRWPEIEKALKASGCDKAMLEERSKLHSRGASRQASAVVWKRVPNYYMGIKSPASRKEMQLMAFNSMADSILKKLRNANEIWNQTSANSLQHVITRESSVSNPLAHWIRHFKFWKACDGYFPLNVLINTPEGQVLSVYGPAQIWRGNYMERRTAFRTKLGQLFLDGKEL